MDRDSIFEMKNIIFLNGVSPKLSGIYHINNRLDGKYYLGSSGDNRGIQRRLTKHLHCLRQNKHENSHLQRAFNKYGEKNFEFIGIMNVEKGENFDVEQYLLDTKKPYLREIGYNFMTDVNKKRYMGDSTEHNKKNVWCKTWTLLDPLNNIIKVTNLSKFCRNNNLNYLSFKQLVNEKCKSVFGWRLYKGNIPKENYRLKAPPLPYDLMDLNGVRHQGNNYIQFCKDKGLRKHGIYRLIKYIEKSFLGYVRFEDYQNGYRIGLQNGHLFDVIDPSGKRYQGVNANKFCREQGISMSVLKELKRGKCKTYKGWKLTPEELKV